ncbi:hypothetical protein ACQPW1_10350 [Nocardia sp. CA-128927]|uniref:hypothetical protein n=1 Tax=Nocardia sp. CA-128927 TaxID=3239975 RepID=UPI003D99EC2D
MVDYTQRQNVTARLEGFWGTDGYEYGSMHIGNLEGEKLHFYDPDQYTEYHHYTDRGKLLISFIPENGLSNWMRYGRFNPTIRISKTKSDEQIAREIERRLLRPVRELVADAKARKEADDEKYAARSALMRKLVMMLGGRSFTTDRGLERRGFDTEMSNNTVRVEHRGNTVEFKITIDPDEALRFGRRISGFFHSERKRDAA